MNVFDLRYLNSCAMGHFKDGLALKFYSTVIQKNRARGGGHWGAGCGEEGSGQG
jgi:hypothetical protein